MGIDDIYSMSYELCWSLRVSTFWSVDVLVCRRFGLSTFWFVDVSVCRRFGLSTLWFVDVSICRRLGLSTFWFVDVSVCRGFGLSTFWLSTFRFVDVLTSNQVNWGKRLFVAASGHVGIKYIEKIEKLQVLLTTQQGKYDGFRGCFQDRSKVTQ